MHGARSPLQDAAHRGQHCCDIIEGLTCSGFNLHLAAFCSWVGRWDDGGESCLILLCCAVLLLPFVLLVYASTEVNKNVVYSQKVLQNLTNEYYNMCLVKKEKSVQVLILGKVIYHAGRYV